jgi:prevent-host-death family protein
MNAVTLADAKENLEQLVEQVLADAEPAILCTEKGEKVVLVSLDEFNSWKRLSTCSGTPPMPPIFESQLRRRAQASLRRSRWLMHEDHVYSVSLGRLHMVSGE